MRGHCNATVFHPGPGRELMLAAAVGWALQRPGFLQYLCHAVLFALADLGYQPRCVDKHATICVQ